MSYGWENSDEDEHATDAVARGGSLIRDKLIKELEAKDNLIIELREFVTFQEGSKWRWNLLDKIKTSLGGKE